MVAHRLHLLRRHATRRHRRGIDRRPSLRTGRIHGTLEVTAPGHPDPRRQPLYRGSSMNQRTFSRFKFLLSLCAAVLLSGPANAEDLTRPQIYYQTLRATGWVYG